MQWQFLNVTSITTTKYATQNNFSSHNSSIGRRQKQKSAESEASCVVGMNRTENLWQINCKWRIWESCYDEFYFKSLMLYMNEFTLLEKCKVRTAVLDHFCRKQMQLVFPWRHMTLHSQLSLSPHEQQTSFQQQMLPNQQTFFTHHMYTLQEASLNDFTFSILNLSNCFMSLCLIWAV